MGYGMYAPAEDTWAPPHAKLSPRLFWVVESALRKAWEMVTSDAAATAAWRTELEDELTLRLMEMLTDTVWHQKMIAGFDNTVFSTPNREAKVRNFNGCKPDKMPDLWLQFTAIPANAKPSQYGIFIECKPVDNAHPVGTHYCGKGIIRFIQGDYAWAMQDGIMLAYATSGYDITKKLLPHLSPQSMGQYAATEKPVCCPQSRDDNFAERTLISTHERDFTYCENGCRAPNINLRHVWLKR